MKRLFGKKSKVKEVKEKSKGECSHVYENTKSWVSDIDDDHWFCTYHDEYTCKICGHWYYKKIRAFI